MPAKPCPQCGKSASAKTAPFCSDRCRKLDLGNWFNESYAIPAVELDDPDLEELAERNPLYSEE